MIGHSYGSYVAGQASEMGMRVDDMVFIGSPGVDARNAGELGMPNEHVWAGAADHDIVPDTPRGLGPNPTDEDFGATVFDTRDSSGHSEYYQGQSRDNLARIALGDYDAVERRPRPTSPAGASATRWKPAAGVHATAGA